MLSDVILNKAETIERCLKRIKEEYDGNAENLKNFTKQDAIILNIQRACEACIDIAMHIVAKKGWGIPQNSRDAFELLKKNGLLEEQLTVSLKKMVGFRNIVVHDYQSLNEKILVKIITGHLKDIEEFVRKIIYGENDS